MEELLKLASAAADAATVIQESGAGTSVSFEDGALKDIGGGMRTSTRLSLVKDGRLGFAYTTNLRDREALVENALLAARLGPEVGYSLPGPAKLASPRSYDPAAEGIGSEILVEDYARVAEAMRSFAKGDSTKSKGEINVGGGIDRVEVRLVNSLGADYRALSSSYGMGYGWIYPASASSLFGSFQGLSFSPCPEAGLRELGRLFSASLPKASPKPGRMKVLLMPDAFYVMAWRLLSGVSARSVRQGISPVADKMGQELISPLVDLYNDPLDDRFPGARAFDDEGTPCKRLYLYKEGKLSGFYADRDLAARLGIEATGCGWSEDATSPPGPEARHLFVSPGQTTFAGMVAGMDRGIIVQSILGAHSGNIPNGDFSIGLSPGIYVEGGEVVGHIDEAMIAGNVYEAMRRVIAVGNEVSGAYVGSFPPVLLDDVAVTLK